MNPTKPAIIIAGKDVDVPSVQINGVTVIACGRLLRIARIYNEEVIEGTPVADPEAFIAEIRTAGLPADVFCFAQRPMERLPRYSYYHELDNVAAVRITTYSDWLAKKVAVDVRQNVRKSSKRGVITDVVALDDKFLQGISEIYNETPIRQGRRFWHYGKSVQRIRFEIERYLDRSTFIGAHVGDELIGFIKMTYTDSAADLALIVTKQSHFDKRATNALIAKAVEICAERGIAYLRYDKMSYGKKSSASLAEFKRRHGFEEIVFPRYFVPLTARGRIGVQLGLHRPLQELLPDNVQRFLLGLRARYYSVSTALQRPTHRP